MLNDPAFNVRIGAHRLVTRSSTSGLQVRDSPVEGSEIVDD
jgi:hypothetical protein